MEQVTYVIARMSKSSSFAHNLLPFRMSKEVCASLRTLQVPPNSLTAVISEFRGCHAISGASSVLVAAGLFSVIRRMRWGTVWSV